LNFLDVLTPWNRVLLEKLTVNFPASQEIPLIYGTRKFLTVPTRARQVLTASLRKKRMLRITHVENSLDRVSKITYISNFMKISPVEAEFHMDGHTDERTDMIKLTVAFRNCANRPKNDCPVLISGKNTRSVWVLWSAFLVHALR
jgi:hypothetical protein